MDGEWLARTRLLFGDDALLRLQQAHVFIAGLGGVGAYAAEMLGRSGVGEMTIVDGDTVEGTNKNRQLLALDSNVGKPKASLMSERLFDINPDIKLHVVNEYVKDDRLEDLLKSAKYDYVVDAIDTLAPKTFLIYNSVRLGLPVASSMGSGGKCDPSMVRIADISESYNCTLARMLRKRLHKLGVYSGVKVVFSPEITPDSAVMEEEGRNKKSAVGTVSYMPPLFGCFLASAVIRDIAGVK